MENPTGYLLPPPDGWWACVSGITTCISLEILNNNHDFCVLVQIVPGLLCHLYEDVLDYWNPDARDLVRQKRELGVTLAVMLGLGLGAAGVATGTSAMALQRRVYGELRAAIDLDIERIEKSLGDLQGSLTSLSEVVLQNRRGLDLLFLKEGGLCAALKEECCFFIDHSGRIKDNLGKIRQSLEQRERERVQGKSWFETWLSSSPWFTTFVSTLLGPLIILLLLLTFGPCILNHLVVFIRERASTVQIMMLRQQYKPITSDETEL